MRIAKLTVAAVAMASVSWPALAAEEILFGPAPEWILETGPTPAEAQSADAGQLPIRVVSSENQTRLEPDRQVAYVSFAMRIQTPQGLSAGNLSLAWQPEFDELTIHKVHIRRGDEIIDVLEEGQTFTTLRREQSLEQATLTGVLTANMFPAGLEVGDTLEVAYSVASSNPVMAGHAEAVLGPFNIPAAEIDVVLQWPEDLPVRLATTRGMPEWQRSSEKGYTLAALSLDNVDPIIPPTGAPSRYSLLRMVEASDFASWQEVADLFVPLYAEASQLPAEGPLRERVEEIRAATTDPARRAELALQLVQDDVRYVALAMGEGGLVPADTATTWQRRYGDCKAKTALLLGILSELGIEAEAVAVNTVFGDALPERLPMVGMFDHILVRAHVGGQQYWMDGTRSGDTSLERLQVPNFHWGLPIIEQGAELVAIVPAAMNLPDEEIAIHMDGSEGVFAPVPTEISITLRGDNAIGTNSVLSQMVGESREQALDQYWRGRYDFIEPQEMDVQFDDESGELVLSLSGLAELEWDNGFYETDDTRVGYNADFTRVEGAGMEAPFMVPHPFFSRTRQTIILPETYDDAQVYGGEYDEITGGIEYRREASVEGNVFTVTRSARSVAAEITFADAQAAEDRLTALWDDRLHLDLPDSYPLTERDIEFAADVEGSEGDAQEFIDRGVRLLDASRFPAAEDNFERAAELDPDNVWAWANLALSQAWQRERDAALASADRADAVEENNEVALRARGMVALNQREFERADDYFSASLQAEPDHSWSHFYRALSRFGQMDHERALEDAERAIELWPTYPAAHTLRATLLMNLERREEALTAINEMLEVLPDDPAVQTFASEFLFSLGEEEQSDELLATAAEDNPSPMILVSRANRRPLSEADEKLADLNQALELAPEYVPALIARADALWADYRYDEALIDADQALEIAPDAVEAYEVKAKILVEQDRLTAARQVAEDLIAANPETAFAFMTAANIYQRTGDDELAQDMRNRQIAVGPTEGGTAYALLQRARERSPDDLAGREEDIEAALAIDPDSEMGLRLLADLQMRQGNFGSAAGTLQDLASKDGGEPSTYNTLGMALMRAGRSNEANAAFDRARELAGNAIDLNSLCWDKAVASIALERALEECNASLDLTEHAATLDSRAMVYLRMGRLDEARADFDRAIEQSPALANSLFGRAIIQARQGDEEGAQRDAREARRHWPEVDEAFTRDYQMEIPDAIAISEEEQPVLIRVQ